MSQRRIKSLKSKAGYQHREHRSKRNRTKKYSININGIRRYKKAKEALKLKE